MQSPIQEYFLQALFFRQNETITWLSVRAWFMSWKIQGNFHFSSFAMCSRINLEVTVKSSASGTGCHFKMLRQKKKGKLCVRACVRVCVLLDESGRSTIYECHYVRRKLKFAEFMLDIKRLCFTTISHLLEVQWHLNALYWFWAFMIPRVELERKREQKRIARWTRCRPTGGKNNLKCVIAAIFAGIFWQTRKYNSNTIFQLMNYEFDTIHTTQW